MSLHKLGRGIAFARVTIATIETARWSDVSQEVSVNAILTAQKYAKPGAWYVPYKTGILLVDGHALIATHIGEDAGESFVFFTKLSRIRTNLMTDGIYDCAGFTLEMDRLKLLIHAFGASSLHEIATRLLSNSSFTEREKTEKVVCHAYVNSKYVLGIPQYLLAINKLLYQWKNKDISHHFIHESSIVRV